jgi:hypothetical protein
MLDKEEKIPEGVRNKILWMAISFGVCHSESGFEKGITEKSRMPFKERQRFESFVSYQRSSARICVP